MSDQETIDKLLRKAREAFHEADKAEHKGYRKGAQRLLREAADAYSQLDTMVSLDGKLPWQWDPKQIRVRCDENNNPPEEVEKGNLHVNIEFIPPFFLQESQGEDGPQAPWDQVRAKKPTCTSCESERVVFKRIGKTRHTWTCLACELVEEVIEA